jgi:hypothetical protein
MDEMKPGWYSNPETGQTNYWDGSLALEPRKKSQTPLEGRVEPELLGPQYGSAG